MISLMRCLRLGLVVCSLVFAGVVACSAGGGGDDDDGGGATGAGAGTGLGGGLNTGGAGSGISGAFGTGGSAGGEVTSCQNFNIQWKPQTPTVYLLVDRSGSMFATLPGAAGPDGQPPTIWGNLRDGVLKVVENLQEQVRFGFGAFTGEGSSGVGCDLIFDEVVPNTNNFQPISDVYVPLKQISGSDTPVIPAFQKARDALIADREVADGEKYVLFVTDAEPDYCNDGTAECAGDHLIFAIDQMYKQDNIKTIVFGIKSTLTGVSEQIMAAAANAGSGQPYAYFDTSRTVESLYDWCATVPPWAEAFATTGKTPRTALLGDYAAENGPAVVYKPDAANQQELINQFSSVLQGVKACEFNLQGNIKVNRARLPQTIIKVEGQPIEFDPANGWTMRDDAEIVVLNGAACELWRRPESVDIHFGFTCDDIIE